MALIFALRIWRYYLLATKFTVHTDNRTLTYIQKNKDLTARLTRWSLKLQEFDFDIFQRKKSNKFVPNTLSRLPNISNDIKINSKQEKDNKDDILTKKITNKKENAVSTVKLKI